MKGWRVNKCAILLGKTITVEGGSSGEFVDAVLPMKVESIYIREYNVDIPDIKRFYCYVDF